GDDVPLVGRQGLEQPADGAAEDAAVVGLDDRLQAVDAEHPAADALAGGRGVVLDDGAVAGQVALGPDALGGVGVLGPGRVLLVGPGDVVAPRRLRPVLPHLHPDLLLLVAHAVSVTDRAAVRAPFGPRLPG